MNNLTTPKNKVYIISYKPRKSIVKDFFNTLSEVEIYLASLGTIRDYWSIAYNHYAIEIETVKANVIIVNVYIK